MWIIKDTRLKLWAVGLVTEKTTLSKENNNKWIRMEFHLDFTFFFHYLTLYGIDYFISH